MQEVRRAEGSRGARAFEGMPAAVPSGGAAGMTRESGTGKYERLAAGCKDLQADSTPILVGPAQKIEKIAKQAGVDLGRTRIVDAPHSHASAPCAVELVRQGEAELLMKGSLHTDELLAEVVARETGLRTGRRLTTSSSRTYRRITRSSSSPTPRSTSRRASRTRPTSARTTIASTSSSTSASPSTACAGSSARTRPRTRHGRSSAPRSAVATAP